ncbi:MAG: hypothetical protein OQL16_13750 [Gammaproteobacteria bacterium]|nr:hypothetical protein [Gammaproteobacteria bacterium]
MNNPLQNAWQWLTTDLRRLAVLISAIFSVWVILTNDTVNSDGILYVDVAYHIGNWDWRAALKLYMWNFYPILIALIHKITFLELEASAFLLNSLFFAGIAWLFISILQTLGANRQVLIAGLIIISIHPYINEYRADIFRGPGFWFCIMWVLSLLIKIHETGKLVHGILLGLALIIATLFRIEGIAFLVFAPLALLFIGNTRLTTRLMQIASIYLLPLACGLLLLLAWLINGDSIPTGRLTDPFELVINAYNALAHKIPEKGEILATQVLDPKSDDFGVVGVIATLFTILLLTSIKRITLLVLILAIYAKLKIQIKHMPILIWLSMINIAYMAVYVTYYFFLSSRFAMPVALFAALPASFALAKIFQSTDSSNWKLRSIQTLSVLFIIFMLLDGLISTGESKRYQREAGYWLEQNIQPGETLLANLFHVNYYANIRMTHRDREILVEFARQLDNGDIQENAKYWLNTADYIAIRVKHLDPSTVDRVSTILGRQPIKEFSASDKERVVIYHNRK